MTISVIRCPGCGIGESVGLTYHHIVPKCFTQWLPESERKRFYKCGVLVCDDCHQQYEKEANILKLELYKQAGINSRTRTKSEARIRAKAILIRRAERGQPVVVGVAQADMPSFRRRIYSIASVVAISTRVVAGNISWVWKH